jgi:uncharacterized membrane protein
MTFLGGLLAALLVFALLAGAVLGWVSALTLGRLRARLTKVEWALADVEAELRRLGGATPGTEAEGSRGPEATEPREPSTQKAPLPSGAGWAAPASRPAPATRGAASAARTATAEGPPRPAPGRKGLDRLSRIFAGIREHWMVWLGGLSIGLAGLFLVRYSIEQGYLGPTARVLLGMATGGGLHVLAEWLRRRMQGRYDAVAALAGGASLTLYAAVLAALHLYALWPPGVIFALLALISLGTMVLALRHGPVLAILGILGAYAVPALLGGDAEQLLTVLIYSLIVTMASFVLMRYVYRDWLWWGTVAGALFWWWIALQAGGHTEAWLGVYLAVLAWSTLALRPRNYRLTRLVTDPEAKGHWQQWLRSPGTEQGPLRVSLVALLLAQAYSIALDPQWSLGPLLWLPLPVVILLASQHNEGLRPLPWLTLAAMAAGLVGSVLDWEPLYTAYIWSVVPVDAAYHGTVLATLGLLAALFSAAGLWQLWARRDSALAASLAFLSPLVALALAYILVPEALPRWGLSVLALLVGLVLGGLAGRRLKAGTTDAIAFWQIAAGHLAYSLAVVIRFDEATLTLALAVQVLSLTWLLRRFGIRHLNWLVILVLTTILVRLTLNPWLLDYADAARWTLWTYGGSLVLVWLAARVLEDGQRLKPWLQAASLHLLMLFLHTQMRYLLYDGDVFAARYDFLEAALNTGLWAALALLYYRRSVSAAGLPGLYRGVAQVLMLLAVGSYLLLVTAMNPLWDAASSGAIGGTPILNALLLAYGLPVVLWGLASRLYEPDLRPFFAVLAGVALWLFVSLEIRHLWQGQLDFFDPVRDGELYTYSVVWLLMAVGTMLLGTLRAHKALYRGGLVLLALVILKIFFVDMAGLTGLLRALSFMGLGLSLLGLAFMHQYLGRRSGDTPASASAPGPGQPTP